MNISSVFYITDSVQTLKLLENCFLADWYVYFRIQSDEQQPTMAEPSTVSSPDSSETELDELDDDFNNVIASIDRDEQNALNFDIPENFDMKELFAKITFKREITQSHMRINALLAKLDPENPLLIIFVKKLFFKMSTFIKSLKLDMQNAGSIPESTLAKCFNQVHEYTTSLEYIMSCLILFDIGTERSFEDEHKIICYRITECIREFVIEQKVTELPSSSVKVPKRFVTDASRPRIRYVAGYCVSALRKRYTQIKQSKMFSHSKEAQSAFREAKISINIINLLKEEEHYLKETTTDRESLTDTERKQNVNRGLTNVTDSMFDFFLCLTNTCLSKLVHENLVNYGESMYNMCLDVVQSDSNLYEKFSHMVILRLHTENIEEFHDSNMNLSEHLETMVITSAQIYHIYNELVRKYFMVLFAQFCRDVKAAFKIQKTMAHRKQIKVAKSTETSTATNSSVKSTKQMGNKRKTDAEKPAAMSQTDLKPGASVSSHYEPKPGTSASDSDTCVKCHTGEGNDWIQCDGCDSWLHRKCAGLSNYKKWKKFSKESVSWFCKDCE